LEYLAAETGQKACDGDGAEAAFGLGDRSVIAGGNGETDLA